MIRTMAPPKGGPKAQWLHVERERAAPRGQSGMSLIEVLAVALLLAVVLLVAIPQLTVPGTVNASTMAQQIAADLHLARRLAIANRVNYALQFSPPTAPYTSYTVRDASSLVEAPDFPKTIPAEVTVSGRQAVIFTPDGCVDDDGTGTACVGTDGSVTVTGGAATATVQVYWYAGRVKVVGP